MIKDIPVVAQKASHVGRTKKEIAERFGVSPPYFSDTLALRKIPEEIQKIIPRGIKRSCT